MVSMQVEPLKLCWHWRKSFFVQAALTSRLEMNICVVANANSLERACSFKSIIWFFNRFMCALLLFRFVVQRVSRPESQREPKLALTWQPLHSKKLSFLLGMEPESPEKACRIGPAFTCTLRERSGTPFAIPQSRICLVCRWWPSTCIG